jgi:hypothetical protein
VIIHDEAQVRRDGLGCQRQEGAGGEVDDPQVVDAGGLEGLGRAGNVLAKQIPAAVGIEFVLFKPAIDGRERRQRGVGLFPLPVEQFDGHPGERTDALEDPLLLGGG